MQVQQYGKYTPGDTYNVFFYKQVVFRAGLTVCSFCYKNMQMGLFAVPVLVFRLTWRHIPKNTSKNKV